MQGVASLVPRPSLTASKKAVREGLGTRLGSCYLEDLPPSVHIGERNVDEPVNPARPEQGLRASWKGCSTLLQGNDGLESNLIDEVGPVGCRNYQHLPQVLHPIHLSQELS